MKQAISSKILNYLIQQCKHPKGFIGNIMIRMWNQTFPKMALWGLSHVSLKETDIILEIGFGGGVMIQHLVKEKRYKKIYGIDRSAAAVAKARKLNEKAIEKNEVQLFQSSVANMNFPYTFFDKIFAIQTHIYWEDFEISIQKIFDVLSLEGEFNIICEKDKIFYHLPQYLAQNKMIALLEEIGFVRVQVFETSRWIQYRCEKV